MQIKKHIPNLLTLTNLFSGCILVYYTANYNFLNDKNPYELLYTIVFLLGVSLVADLLDGMVARALNVSSPIGLQLDSLADMVTFGVFPGMLMLKMMHFFSSEYYRESLTLTAFFGLLITLFSALRLAKFNVDTTQISYFKGLATPANAILIVGVYALTLEYPEFFFAYGGNLLISITVLSSLMLVANVPLFSFKLKSFRLKDILPQLILLIGSILFVVFLKWAALVPIIILYIFLSLLFKKNFTHA